MFKSHFDRRQDIKYLASIELKQLAIFASLWPDFTKIRFQRLKLTNWLVKLNWSKQQLCEFKKWCPTVMIKRKLFMIIIDPSTFLLRNKLLPIWPPSIDISNYFATFSASSLDLRSWRRCLRRRRHHHDHFINDIANFVA